MDREGDLFWGIINGMNDPSGIDVDRVKSDLVELSEIHQGKDPYFLEKDGKKYCAAFKIYPSGYPVTSSTHAVENSDDEKILCGVKWDDGFQHDEWGNGIECKKCMKIIGGSK